MTHITAYSFFIPNKINFFYKDIPDNIKEKIKEKNKIIPKEIMVAFYTSKGNLMVINTDII